MAKASDNKFPKLIVTEGATPSNPASGDQKLFIDTADHKLKRVNSSGTVTTIEGGGGGGSITYGTYVPVLTAATTNPTLGTGGSIVGRYYEDGEHVEGHILVTFGTSGVSAGSGTYYLSPPTNIDTTHAFAVVGQFYLYDSSAGNIVTGILARNSTSTMSLFQTHASAAAIGSASPWTWAANDLLIVHFSYEKA